MFAEIPKDSPLATIVGVICLAVVFVAYWNSEQNRG